MQKSALVSAGLLTASVAHAAPIPDSVAAMLGAAAGDAAQLQVIADTAKKANPRSATEIDAKVAGMKRTRRQDARIPTPPAGPRWFIPVDAG